MLDSVAKDLGIAMRTRGKSRGFTVVAIASLGIGIGIGANTTIFSLVRATLLPTLPYREVARLVDLHETSAVALRTE